MCKTSENTSRLQKSRKTKITRIDSPDARSGHTAWRGRWAAPAGVATPRVSGRMRAAPTRPTLCTPSHASNRSRHHWVKQGGPRVTRTKPHAVPASGSAMETAQFMAGAVTGAALVLIAWPKLQRELKPIRCKECRGMSWVICDTCLGRGKTGLNLTSLGDAKNSNLSYCKLCAGRGRTPCVTCDATGIENNWLYGPTENPGWGPRGAWRDPEKPPPMNRK